MRPARATLPVLAALALGPAAASAAPFAVRGIVEGAYGRPWTAHERTEMLRWMGEHGLNTYVHAPKDDLYQRTRWRDPYPAAQQRAFDREIAGARARGIAWVPNLSPALPLIPTAKAPDGPPSRDLCFSCPADLAALRAKLEPFVHAGATQVAISFDDVAKLFSHPEDLAAYGAGDEAFGRACGDVLTRLKDAFAARGEDVRILTVGADYSGTADTAFLKGFRAALAPGIDAMWTGDDVPSTDFSARDARAYGAAIGRTPIVWDNWTNTDTAGSAIGPAETVRLFLGPYARRAGLGDSVKGFLLNPANEAATNKLPLATAAAYLAGPDAYDRGAAFTAAVAELAPRRLRAPLRAFAETMWSSKLDRTHDAPTFSARRDAFVAAYDAGGAWPAPRRRAGRELRLVTSAPRRLARLPDRELQSELEPFEQAASRAARAGRAALGLLAAERPSVAIDARHAGATVAPPDAAAVTQRRVALAAARTTYTADTRFAYGWKTPYAFDIPPYAVTQNAMSAFLDAVTSRDAAWSPLAATGVSATVNGRPVAGAAFPVACGDLVEAVDRAGGRTAKTVRCARSGLQGS